MWISMLDSHQHLEEHLSQIPRCGYMLHIGSGHIWPLAYDQLGKDRPWHNDKSHSKAGDIISAVLFP